MKIRQIHVSAGRTLSLPNCCYSNSKPTISLTADLEDGEDALAAARELHKACENLMEDQCDDLVAFIMARTQHRNRQLKQEKKPQPAAPAGATAG